MARIWYDWSSRGRSRRRLTWTRSACPPACSKANRVSTSQLAPGARRIRTRGLARRSSWGSFFAPRPWGERGERGGFHLTRAIFRRYLFINKTPPLLVWPQDRPGGSRPPNTARWGVVGVFSFFFESILTPTLSPAYI